MASDEQSEFDHEVGLDGVHSCARLAPGVGTFGHCARYLDAGRSIGSLALVVEAVHVDEFEICAGPRSAPEFSCEASTGHKKSTY